VIKLRLLRNSLHTGDFTPNSRSRTQQPTSPFVFLLFFWHSQFFALVPEHGLVYDLTTPSILIRGQAPLGTPPWEPLGCLGRRSKGAAPPSYNSVNIDKGAAPLHPHPGNPWDALAGGPRGQRPLPTLPCPACAALPGRSTLHGGRGPYNT